MVRLVAFRRGISLCQSNVRPGLALFSGFGFRIVVAMLELHAAEWKDHQSEDAC